METKYTQRHRCLRAWSEGVLLTALVLCAGVALADTPARHYQVAVFTNGLTATPVMQGLKEGLAQLGYVEGKNVTLIVVDTHGVVADLVQRATRLAVAC